MYAVKFLMVITSLYFIEAIPQSQKLDLDMIYSMNLEENCFMG